MIEYLLETEIRIDWSDIDMLGHVNNLAIMRYMQTARVIFFEKLGMSANSKSLGIGPIMASVSGQFKKQLGYPGNIRVLSTIDELKTTSLHMKHYVINEMNEIAAEGHDVIVIYDFEKKNKHSIPEDLRDRIGKMEAKNKIFHPESKF